MILFYYGEDSFTLARETKALKAKFAAANPAAGGEEISVSKDSGDTALRNSLQEIVQNQGLFAVKKMVVLKNLLTYVKDFPETEGYILEILKNPPADITLVIAQEENCDKRLKFFKALQKMAQGREFLIPAGKDLENWISVYLGTAGFTMESQALAEFMKLLGQNGDERLYDLWQVSGELEKLMLSKISGETLLEFSDVRDSFKPNISQNIFALTNLFAEGRGREAMSLLEKIVSVNAAAELKTQTIQIIGGLASQIRSLLLVKDLEGLSPAKVADMLGWKEGRVWINSKLAKKFTKEKLVSLLKDLRALDLRLKTSEEPPKLLLSLFLQKAKA